MSSLLKSDDGIIFAVSTSRSKGVKKLNTDTGILVEDLGLLGDAHAGPWHRQVSLLAQESIARVRARGIDAAPGDFAENITTSGLRLWELKVGTRLALGEHAVLEVTQIGKICHDRCDIYHRAGDCVMPREGLFARVVRGGRIGPGSLIRVLKNAEA